MVDTLFPSLTYTHVGDVLEVLRHNGNIKDEGWTAFEALCSPKNQRNIDKYEPHHSSQSEDVTFKSLEQIFEQIQQANASLGKDLTDGDLPQGARMGDTSNQASLVTLSIHSNALAESWPNSAKPGGSIHLKKTSLPWPRIEEIDSKGNTHSIIDYADICLIIETKLCRTLEDVKSNRSKLFWNAHHKLNSDPRCRFVTGITVEDTLMHFWYFDRASILISMHFDFMLEPRKLIRVLLGYIIAPNEASLGFDTTVHCTGILDEYSGIIPKPDEDGARIYDIEVHNSSDGSTTLFRTTRCLANSGVLGICGRSTRVWEVVKVDGHDPERTRVLKDTWVDEDQTTEGARLRDIHDHASPEELQFFLKVECHGVVLIEDMESTREDKTFYLPSSTVADSSTIIIKYSPPYPPLTTSESTSMGSGSTSSASSRGANSQASSVSGESLSLIQGFTTADYGAYATDDRYTCTPLTLSGVRKHYRIAFADPPGRSINDLTTPEDAFEALHGGLKAMKAMLKQNLMHRDIGAGNILLGERGGEKTGVLMDLGYTKEFPGDNATPHTVQTGTKQFMSVEVLDLGYCFQPRRRRAYQLGWSHNPLHDVESTWWIAVWILYHLIEIEFDDDDKSHRADLFSTANPQARAEFFCDFTTGLGFQEKLPVTVSDIIADWRMALIDFYEEQQLDLKQRGHELFDYDKAITDAIHRIEGIRSALLSIDSPFKA